MRSARLLVLVAVMAALAASVRSASAGHRSVEAAGSSQRLPAYGLPNPVGRSHELGSVYVTDAIGSADFNGDGLPDAVYTTANDGSTSTFAMQFALNRSKGRFVNGGKSLLDGPVPGRRAAVDS